MAAGEEAMKAMPDTAMQWLQTLELGYTDTTAAAPAESVCFGCGAVHSNLSVCVQCNVAGYCQKDCQVNDWKTGGHKAACASYKRLGSSMNLPEQEFEAVRNQIFQRIRFYACPYAVHKASTLGRGFMFVQSDCTLAMMSLLVPKDCYGRLIQNRNVLLHYLTMGEYDAEVCRDDFEMTVVRTKLQEAVETYDEQTQVVILMRMRCGHVALGMAALVPDYGLCRKLGLDYYSESTAGAVQLNLDSM
jgi:hypothetical protein